MFDVDGWGIERVKVKVGSYRTLVQLMGDLQERLSCTHLFAKTLSKCSSLLSFY